MEKDILVKVRVSDDVHADLIYKDVLNVVKNRTSIYYIAKPRLINTTIADSFKYNELDNKCDNCGVLRKRYPLNNNNEVVIICAVCGRVV